jgi:succinoglycan biosynthesis transport protein ExoP
MNEPSPYFRPTLIHADRIPSEADPSLLMFGDQALGDEETSFDPWKYWFVVRKHLRLIVAVFVASLLIATYRIFTTTPLYTAETLLVVKPKIPEVLAKGVANDLNDQDYSENFYRTQYLILDSRSLAAKVIQSQGLEKNEVFLGGHEKPGAIVRFEELVSRYSGLAYAADLAGGLLSNLRAFVSPGPVFQPDDKRAQDAGVSDGGVDPQLINAYLGMLSIIPVPETSLVKILFSTSNPELSAQLANAHAAAYARMGIELHNQANEAAQRFLQNRLSELGTQLEKSEVALNDYRRQNSLIPGLMSLDGKETVVIDRLKDLSKELTAAELERIGLEAQVQFIRSGKYSSLPTVMSNPDITTLQTALSSEYAEIAGMATQFKPDYPPLAQLEAKAKANRERMNDAVSKLVAGVESAYQVAVGKENELRAEMEQQKQQALGLNDAAVKYAMLQREVDTNRELTNNVLQKMKDVGLEAESEASNVSVIDKAETPLIASSPKKLRDLLQGAGMGLAGGLILALALEYLSSTLSSPEEVEKYLQLPNLGVIPEFSSLTSGTYGPSLFPSEEVPPNPGEDSRELVLAFKRFSLPTEAYRTLRTGLLLSRAGAPPKLTLFTSALRGEGKTVTAVNTAVMLAQLGRVLLIDADLRRARSHKILGLENNGGLTEFLIGAIDLDSAIRPTGIENLSVITSGATPPNSSELVGSTAMHSLLTNVARTYDFVVVDSPPLFPVSDGLLLSTMVDGVVLVVDSSRTPKKQVKMARMRLQYARAKVFGFVLNKMHARSFHYHHYYDAYYTENDQAV